MNGTIDIIIFVMQIVTSFVLLYLACRLYKFFKTKSLDKRFEDYAVEIINDDSESLFDIMIYYYKGIRNRISKALLKSKVLTDYSNKYEKYSTKSRISKIDKMNYITSKIFVGLLCVFLLLFSCLFRTIKIDFYILLLVFLIGFFLLDLYWIIDDKFRKKRIERDMGQAIVIMNNAFRSGYSIMQAIYLVYKELDGPISLEFKKMYMDITFGLNMEVVFKRFSERVKCVEATYMSTSLAVLNKTGGNIVQVFNSVERNSMVRKKLKDELDSVSASARAMFKILVCIPILIVGMLVILNPGFFNPLLTTPIGIMCLLLSIMIYILYIIIIRKIVYVEVKL